MTICLAAVERERERERERDREREEERERKGAKNQLSCNATEYIAKFDFTDTT
jgi:hypothetical protein